jgi:hypothetical protein
VTNLYPQNLALTSPTSGGRSVGIVRSRTQATESFLLYEVCIRIGQRKTAVTMRAGWNRPNDVRCIPWFAWALAVLSLQVLQPASSVTLIAIKYTTGEHVNYPGIMAI